MCGQLSDLGVEPFETYISIREINVLRKHPVITISEALFIHGGCNVGSARAKPKLRLKREVATAMVVHLVPVVQAGEACYNQVSSLNEQQQPGKGTTRSPDYAGSTTCPARRSPQPDLAARNIRPFNHRPRIGRGALA